MLLLVFGVVRAPDVAAQQTVAAIAAGFALLAAFVIIERRSAAPLVRLGILRSTPLLRANLGALLFVGSFIGFQFITVLYLQELRGWSALSTGLALMIAGLDAVLAPTLTPILVRRYGNLPVTVAGMAVAVVAYVWFLALDVDWSYAVMLPTLILIGVAFSLVYGPLTIAATDGVDESEQGLAGGLLNASVQFGAALILAIVTAVNVSVTGTDPTEADLLDGYRKALIVPPVMVAIAGVLTASGLRAARRARA
jgi:predicted MFS family arabinose efflux permease